MTETVRSEAKPGATKKRPHRTKDTELRTQALLRVQSGESIAAVAADTGISASTLYRWKRKSAQPDTSTIGVAAGELAEIAAGTRALRYWPLGPGRIVTSWFGSRDGEWHAGIDFGRRGGSANMPVYACQAGTVIYAGDAQGYGGPDPAGWLVIDSSDEQGSGCVEYGHIVREVAKGEVVRAGQRIAHINPNTATNGHVPPHLHVSVMPYNYNPAAKSDPMPWLQGALEPAAATAAEREPPNLTERSAMPENIKTWNPPGDYTDCFANDAVPRTKHQGPIPSGRRGVRQLHRGGRQTHYFL